MTGVLLGLTLMGVGGIPPVVSCLFGAGAAGLLGFTLWHERSGTSASWPLLAVVFAGLSLATLAQCIPLPMGLLGAIAPDNADVWARAMAPLGQGAPSAAPLSLAPELTLVEAVKWGGYAALAWVGYYWARGRGLESVALLALSLAVLAAAVTAAHGALSLTKLFGFYSPTQLYPRWRLGPLLNSNHLSGFLALGAYGGLSVLIAGREPPTARTALVLAGTASLILGVVLLASRAAVAMLVVGALLLPVAIYQPGEKKRRSRNEPRRTGIALAASVFVAGVALALFGYREEIFAGLGERDWSKLQIARDSVPMVRDHWKLGVGRGAFEGVYFAYKTLGRHEFWSHPENIVVQWLSEWGVPVSAVGAAGIGAAVFRASSWRSSVTARVLLLGLLLLLAHNLLDYSLEVPAVAGLAAFMLGAITGSPGGSASEGAREARDASRSRGAGARPRLAVASAFGAALLGLSLIALASRPEALRDVRQHAHALAQAELAPEAQAFAAVGSWMKRFPAEPYFPLTGGVLATRVRPMSSLPWFERTLERAPNMGAAHLALAEALSRAGYRGQALLEIRLALDRDEGVILPATRLTVRVARTAAEIIGTSPLDRPYGLTYLEGVASVMPRDAPIASALREFVLERQPCALGLREIGVRDLLARIAAGAAPCSGPPGIAACRALVEPELAKMRACPDGDGLATLLTADLLWSSDERPASIAMLEQACTGQPGDMTGCLQLLAERAAVVRDLDKVRHNVRIVVSRRCQGPDACGAAWAWASRVHASAEDHASAYVAATKATEIDPTNIELRRALAEAALRVGARERAEAVLQYILARRPDDQPARARLAQIRAMPTAPAQVFPAGSAATPQGPRRPTAGSFLDRPPPPRRPQQP
jgi:tetratricopeptide (TPR) repeat protein